MKLVTVQVRKFRNILDSEEVKIQPDVTCLVGKNEAGKSAFLHALNRLRPARGNPKFSVLREYPAWIQKRDEMRGENLDEARPIKAGFALDEEDKKHVTEKLGKGVLSKDVITLERNYGDTLYYQVSTSEEAAVHALLKGLSTPSTVASQAEKVKTLKELRTLATALQSEAGNPEHVQAGQSIAAKVTALYGDKSVTQVAFELLEQRIPKFFYFSEYASLPYTVRIQHVLKS